MKKIWIVALAAVFFVSSFVIVRAQDECHEQAYAMRFEFSYNNQACLRVSHQMNVSRNYEEFLSRKDDFEDAQREFKSTRELAFSYLQTNFVQNVSTAVEDTDTLLKGTQQYQSATNSIQAQINTQQESDKTAWNSYLTAFNDLDENNRGIFLARYSDIQDTQDFPAINKDNAKSIRSSIKKRNERIKDIQNLRLNALLGDLDIPILMYHRIRPYSSFPVSMHSPNLRELTVEPGDFSLQLTILKEQGYNTITFEELKQAIDEYNVDFFKQKNIILTFDDSYKEHYTFVLPELQKRDMKGVFGIITGRSELNRSEIGALHENGMEIIPHTHSHCALGSTHILDGRENPDGGEYRPCQNNRFGFLGQELMPFEQTKHEIIDSARVIQEYTGFFPSTMMYPYGSYNQTTLSIMDESDFRFGIKAWGGSKQDLSKPFELNRTIIEGRENGELANWFGSILAQNEEEVRDSFIGG